jgi:hypothetical protein
MLKGQQRLFQLKAFAMLQDPCHDCAGQAARALARAMAPVAAELRLINAADLVAYIHEERFANIQDLVNSSAELFFKPGTVSFGWSADVEVDWNSAPVVALGMEFRHRCVWLVFKLVLRALQAEVTIVHASLARTAGGAKQDLELLLETIDDAQHCSGNGQTVRW